MKVYIKFLVVFAYFVATTCIVYDIEAQTKVYKIGGRGPGGGYIFYDKGSYSNGWRYLEAAPNDQGEAQWGCIEKSIPGAEGTSIGSGKSNTLAIERNCGESSIAAKLCTTYNGGGKSDWFLPSKNEFDLMYRNFHKVGVGGFASDIYWSSSEINAKYAWSQYFYIGGQDYCLKNDYLRVRAIRAF